jgi:N,N'-diacetyllegionaminate synthase
MGDKYIGNDQPVFIIAEAGVNHNGRLVVAKQLIKAAKRAGADAVKFQTWKTEELIIKGTETAEYQRSNTGEREQYEMLKKLELSYGSFRKLKRYADKLGIIFLSTPDEEMSLNFLVDDLHLPIIKIGSSELTNYLYLRKISAKHQPMILSTGMGSMGEVKKAIRVITEINPNLDLVILHCTTNYPCPPEDVNLNVLKTYQKEFPKYIIGYSDHTAGINVPVLAVALGAKIIEKHFTLDHNMEGPDHKASLNPEDFKLMVIKIRETEKNKKEIRRVLNSVGVKTILGSSRKRPTISELKIKAVVQKIIVAKRNTYAGDVISEDNIVAKRTSQKGLTADKYKYLIGKILKFNIKKNQAINIRDAK